MTIDDFGRLQLESAIELFFTEKYVPALTLAGAAEELLGQLVKCRCKTPSALESDVKLIQDIGKLELLSEEPEEPTETEIKACYVLNFAKNLVKHWNPKTDAYEPDLDFKEEAKDMLDRAYRNYSDLYPGDFSNTLVEKFMTYQVNELEKSCP